MKDFDAMSLATAAYVAVAFSVIATMLVVAVATGWVPVIATLALIPIVGGGVTILTAILKIGRKK